MAYDEHLAERMEHCLEKKKVKFEAKKMMGGLCFMVNDKMCAGIVGNKMMARIDPEIQPEMLKKSGCTRMDFTGKPLKGFVFVDPPLLDMEADLAYWVGLCLDYNPKAKSSKKKK
jgi:TfoX/Sxy family transcriptional regulator of competence genes